MKYLAILLLTFVYSFADDITVTITYGDERPDTVIETTYKEGETALEVLQKAAEVKVANGKYKFVRSINGKKSIPGVYGWFYLVNDKSPGKMASGFKLESALSMTWYYKVEQCY